MEIFCSSSATLTTRITYAAIVCTFLGIWRNWIVNTPRLTLKENFISRETYIDTLLSCHFAVSFICHCRDNFPDLECHLEESGTDCNETYFSTIGQWTGNKHNYTFYDMRRNASHCMRIEKLRADPTGPKFCKPHPKGESIWHKQNSGEVTPPDLKDYPESGEEISAWKDGVIVERQLAVNVGISPSYITEESDLQGFERDDCFFKPFGMAGNSLIADEEEVDESSEDESEEEETAPRIVEAFW